MKYNFIYILLLILILNNLGLFSQSNIDSLKINKLDSIHNEQSFEIKSDSINKLMQKQIAIKKANENGLDSIVTYRAKDSIIFEAKSKKMFLNRDAYMKFKNQTIEAYQIVISFDESTLEAVSFIDSNKRYQGVPKFNDNGKDYYGQNIKFNFKNAKGVISLGETQMDNQFFFGEKIKRISNSEYFVSNGYYTTCDNPEPHYHFGSAKMKVITDDKVFFDPVVFYIEDLPVMIVPFGLYFPNNKGRQSGLIVPSFLFTTNRGVVFRDLGFYWAASDYWDTQVKTDIYSKGGIMVKNYTQWILLNNFTGNFNIEYGRTRENVDTDYSTNWKFNLRHNHQFTPYDQLNVDLNFISASFNRNTRTDLSAFIQQSIRSSASYNKQFYNGTSLSTFYERDQNTVNENYSQSASMRYNLPSKKIFNSFSSLPNWARDITFSYGIGSSYSDRSDLEMKFIPNNIDSTQLDTIKSYKYSNTMKIEHRPSLIIAPKLGYFVVSPSINFAVNNYFRRINKVQNPSDSTVTYEEVPGFFTEYNYNFGLNVSTNLYAVVDDRRPLFFLLKPSDLGIKAFRHAYTPRLGWSLSPDQSNNDAFFGRYIDQRTNQEVLYSKFELDGGIANRALRNAITYSDQHVFEIKVKQNDTLPDKNIELLKFDFSTAYDFARDSLQLNDIRFNFRSNALPFLDVNGSTNLRPYDEQFVTQYDSISQQIVTTPKVLNQFRLANGKGLFRVTSFSLNLSTRFNSSGIQLTEEFPTDTSTINKDSMSYGERYTRRQYLEGISNDIYGDNSPGYTSFSFPWSVTLGLIYSYNLESIDTRFKQQSISFNIGGNLKLTNTWNLSFNGGYDFVNHNLMAPNIALTKDLHCWDLVFNWTPTGQASGFHFRIGIKASQLRDLKYEKQEYYILR